MRKQLLRALVCLTMALVSHSVLATCTFTDSDHPQVIHPEDCGCVGDGVTDDTACWQEAIDTARTLSYTVGSSNVYLMSTVQGNGRGFLACGSPCVHTGAVYKITDTLKVHDVVGGVIDGGNAVFLWKGGVSHPSAPMWEIGDAAGLLIKNMNIKASDSAYCGDASCALHTAIRLNVIDSIPQPQRNTVEHITIDGNNVGGLRYGVHITSLWGGSGDTGADGNILRDLSIGNVSDWDGTGAGAGAAILIEGGQSHATIIQNVYGSASCTSVPCQDTYYVQSSTTVHATGGFATGFDSQFLITNAAAGGATTIRATNAEYCGHLLLDYYNPPSNGDSPPYPLLIEGGRFAINRLDPDCAIVWIDRRGPIHIEGIELESSPSGGETCTDQPVLRFGARTEPADEAAASFVEIESVFFNFEDSSGNSVGNPTNGWDPIELSPNGSYQNNRLISVNNMCFDGDGSGALGPVACKGKAGGALYARTSAEDLAAWSDAPDGEMTFCYDCQAHSSACDASGSGAVAVRTAGQWDCGGGVVTPDGTQTLTNKSISGSQITTAVPTATALGSDPADCAAGQYAGSIDASGNLSCLNLAAKERTRSVWIVKNSSDGTAGTATAENVLGKMPGYAVTIVAAHYYSASALTANNSNYATLTVSKRTSAGASKTTLFSQTTKVTGGTGNWVAFSPISLGAVTNAAIGADGVITWEIAKSGSGVIVPAGILTIEYTIDTP